MAERSFDLLAELRQVVAGELERALQPIKELLTAPKREPPITVGEAASRAGVSESSLRKSIERNNVAGVIRGPGRRIRIDWFEFSQSRR